MLSRRAAGRWASTAHARTHAPGVSGRRRRRRHARQAGGTREVTCPSWCHGTDLPVPAGLQNIWQAQRMTSSVPRHAAARSAISGMAASSRNCDWPRTAPSPRLTRCAFTSCSGCTCWFSSRIVSSAACAERRRSGGSRHEGTLKPSRRYAARSRAAAVESGRGQLTERTGSTRASLGRARIGPTGVRHRGGRIPRVLSALALPLLLLPSQVSGLTARLLPSLISTSIRFWRRG